MKVLNRKNSLVLLFVLFAGLVFAQDKTSPVEKQARELMKCFANPDGCEKIFNKEFLKNVPELELKKIFKSYFSLCGSCVKIVPSKITSDVSASYNLIFEKNYKVLVSIGVEENEPYLVNSLFFGQPLTVATNFDELITEFKKLPGETSLYAAKLSGDNLSVVADHNPDSYLAIGSAFKLYILSELLRTVNNGERKWSDITELKAECMSLPGGILHLKPVGTKITLDSLATLMISISDNTATDNLLLIAGKENVEKMLSVTGHSKPELNIPFLSTMEMFKMKGDPTKKNITDYLSSNDRRKFLKEELTKVKREDFKMWSGPLCIDKIEWFASTKDLCRVMNWIRNNSKNDTADRTRHFLSVNPGITISKEKWNYVGYKGGSEQGVLNMTYLLRSSKGQWYALSCSWNNQNVPLDNNAFYILVSGAVKLLEN